MNRCILPLCRLSFPYVKRRRAHAYQSAEVANSIADMWRSYKHMRQSRRYLNLKKRVFEAMRKFQHVRVLSRRVRQASLSFRKHRVHELIDRAANAARSDQMTEIYRICRQLAPKTRRERVSIRGEDGRTLGPREQFQAVVDYFRAAFSHPNPVGFTGQCEPPYLQPAAIQAAIADLLPVEVWQSCPDIFTQRVAADFQRGVSTLPSRLPSEMTDCTLVLMPKPGKASKLPKDLRPLGIQDPLSKVVAKALRDQLEVQVTGLLASLPQYAYIKGKAIDECICRVVSFCSSVRCAIKAGVESVHARREGQAPSQCYGGIMVGIDLSRAFDTLDRPVLLRTLRFAQVSEPLQRILLEVHNQCKYRVRLGAYEDIFELQCGVRQGCSISPLRFSLFTCWFLNELSLRTSPEWVAKLVTWFADDQHLGWFVSSPGDLDFICRSLRTTFGLLKYVGCVLIRLNQLSHLA